MTQATTKRQMPQQGSGSKRSQSRNNGESQVSKGPEPADLISSKQRGPMMAVLLFGSFVALLAETFLNNALTTIMESFAVSQSTAQWLTTSYLLVVGLMIPMSAWLFNSFKLKPNFLVMMGVFFVGSIVCIFAPNFWVLLAGRLIEAVAAGGLMPFIQNVILMMFPPEKRGMAMGITGLVIGVGPAIGPTISGLILKWSGWQMLFIVLAVASGLTFVLGCVLVHNITTPKMEKTDVLSFVESIVGFGLLLYALSDIGNTGKVTPLLAVLLVVGIVVIIMFCVRQLHLDKPLMNIRVFANGRFSLSTALSTISNISMVGIELVLPLYLQTTRGESALAAGLVMMPGAIVMMLCNPISGTMYDKFGIRRLSLFGYAMLIIGSLPMLWFNASTSLLEIGLLYAVRMVGISFTMMTTFTEGINAIEPELTAHANAASSTVRQIGGSFGTAIAMLVIALAGASAGTGASKAAQAAAQATGYQWGYIIMLIFAIIGFVGSFWLPSAKGAKGKQNEISAAV